MTAYTATTSNASNKIKATAESDSAVIGVTVNGTEAANNASATWVDGDNSVVITVTNGSLSKAYTVAVTKNGG